MRTRIDCAPDIEDISKSFKRHGQFSPIRLRRHPLRHGSYELIYGNRRLAAAQALGWKTIHADVVDASDSDALIMAFSENEDRDDFTDYEKALLIEKLHLLSKRGYSEIADMIGKSPAYVSQHISMLHLFPKGVADDDETKVVLQRLSEKHARALLKIENPKERWNAAKLAVKAAMGAREIEKMATNARGRNLKAGDSSSRTKLRQIIKGHIEALNTRDIASYFSSVSKNRFSKFSYFPPLSKLDSETSKEHLFQMLHDLKGYKASIEFLDLRIVGKIAYGTVTLSNQYSNSAKTINAETRLTIIFEKEGEEWKIVHEHWSTASPSRLMSLFSKDEVQSILVNKSS